jgi:hypothetical protein
MSKIIVALAIVLLAIGAQYARAACHSHHRYRSQRWTRAAPLDKHSALGVPTSDVMRGYASGKGDFDDASGVHPEGRGFSIP